MTSWPDAKYVTLIHYPQQSGKGAATGCSLRSMAAMLFT
jgi:hypothetical protein